VSGEGDSRVVRVRIRGSVQGVGFRDWTERVATGLALRGWVRNRRDGSVEALFCGSAEDVAEMLERCRRGPRSARVTAIDMLEEGGAAPKSFEFLPTE
jgi:acylphosphatase